MKRVHIIGAGGPAGVGMARCLKEHYEVTGQDDSEWATLMMECGEPVYVDGEGISSDADVYLPDSLVHGSSFSPPLSHIDLCRDKSKTAGVLADLAPKTFWVRDTQGAGGAGAQMCQEFLPGDNYSVEFVCQDGKMLAAFQKKRLSYSVKSKTQGIENRGSSAVSVVTDDERVNITAAHALRMISASTNEEINGFYGVDLKYDGNGIPKVTEINAGRLLTASYAFFSGTGYNLPLVGMAAHFGDPIPEMPDYPLGWGQIRQVGQEPRLFPPEVTASWS